jgi:hypothetical protein
MQLLLLLLLMLLSRVAASGDRGVLSIGIRSWATNACIFQLFRKLLYLMRMVWLVERMTSLLEKVVAITEKGELE